MRNLLPIRSQSVPEHEGWKEDDVEVASAEWDQDFRKRGGRRKGLRERRGGHEQPPTPPPPR
jgi:hypothetical protein